MAGIRVSDLYWSTLEPHRNTPYYRMLRFKLLQFAARKSESAGQVNGTDRPFQNGVLKGVWHYRLMSQPDLTLFYTVRGGAVTMAMIGNHADYGFKGNKASAEGRTAERVNNATGRPEAPSPNWNSLRWQLPCDLLTHPDLPELSRGALDVLLWELDAELEQGGRFQKKFGFPLDEADEASFERYLADTQRAADMVRALMSLTIRHDYWSENLDAANDFKVPDFGIKFG